MPPAFRRWTFPIVSGPAAATLVALLAAAPVHAQQQLGAIQGTIIDQTHAVLPGATVTVTNVSTGITRIAITNDERWRGAGRIERFVVVFRLVADERHDGVD